MSLVISTATKLTGLVAAIVSLVIALGQALPNQNVIAYWQYEGETGADIFIGDTNRRFAYNLTSHMATAEYQPVWSSDGSRIAFVSNFRGGSPDIYTMDADGRNLRNITHEIGTGESPVWSPDGRQIAFVSLHARNDDIFVMNADGSNVRQLTDQPGLDLSPTWSPDGQHIAYYSVREGSGEGIYIMDADGKNQRQIVSGDYYAPAWSPDGAKLAFLAGDDRTHLSVMEIGSGSVQRFTVASSLLGITWLPDGHHIAFTIDSCFCAEVYVLDINTGEHSRIPFAGYGGYVPVWRPG
jgi:TolB protein